MSGVEGSHSVAAYGEWEVQQGFDLDAFLSQPLVARVATVGRTGPTVRPLWYLWEEGAFWWLTGGWSNLERLLDRDPRVALVVDTCDLQRGEVLQVTARGCSAPGVRCRPRAPLGTSLLGPDERHWRRFESGVFDDSTMRFALLKPTALRARDLSY